MGRSTEDLCTMCDEVRQTRLGFVAFGVRKMEKRGGWRCVTCVTMLFVRCVVWGPVVWGFDARGRHGCGEFVHATGLDLGN